MGLSIDRTRKPRIVRGMGSTVTMTPSKPGPKGDKGDKGDPGEPGGVPASRTIAGLDLSADRSAQAVVDALAAPLSNAFVSYPELAGETGVVHKQYPHGDVRRYGAVPDGVTDCLAAFEHAKKLAPFVIVPTSPLFASPTYNLSGPLTFLTTEKAQGIKGDDSAKVKLDFINDTDGLILDQWNATVQDLAIQGSSTTKSGIKFLRSGPRVRGNIVSSFGIGVDVAQAAHIIGGVVESNTVMYNALYGIKHVSTGAAQKNAIRYRRNYVVKNGTDADNMTSNATIGSGDGILIDGGYAITVDDNTCEYNTGCGLRVTSNASSLRGITISAPYFERNKYANLHITEGAYDIKNLTLKSPFYSEAGHTPVANALAERELYLYPTNLAVNGFRLPDSDLGKYGFARRNVELRRANFLNSLPLNFIEDVSTRHAANVTTDSGETVLQLTQANNNVLFYEELAYVDPLMEYVLVYDTRRTSATSVTLLANYYDAAAETNLGSSNMATSTSWQTVVKRISGLSPSLRRMRVQFALSSPPSDAQVLVKNIRLIPFLPAFDRATEHVLSRTTNIDFKTVAATTLYTVPTGRTAIITRAVLQNQVASSISAEAAAGIGIAAGESDIFASVTLTGFYQTTKTWTWSSSGVQAAAPAGSVIKLGVDTGAVGTQQTVTCSLFGVLL